MRKSIIPQTPVKQKSSNQSPASSTVQRRIPLSQSPVGKRKPTKINLKLEYMQHEIDEIRRFKEFLGDVNMSTKELIKHNEDRKDIPRNSNPDQKRRNSFSMNQNMFKNHLSESQNSQKPSQTKQSELEIKSEPKRIDLNKLSVISQLIASKHSEINQQISDLKKKIMHSSMWEDKQFFDFTEFNYGIKMTEIEERLEFSQKNLQEKQKQKKNNPDKTLTKHHQNCAVVRFGLCEASSKEGIAAKQYFDVRSNILRELKHINQIYANFQDRKESNESIQFQLHQTQKDEQDLNENSPQEVKTHRLIRSVHLFKSQVSKFASIIQAYRAQQSKRKNQYIKESQNFTAFLYHKVRLLNKEIIEKELLKTKQKINRLKHKTEIIENGIKELEAFKALNLLRNKLDVEKSLLEKKGNSKSLKLTQKSTYDDEVLRMILEHQFFTKNLALKIETKFTGFDKRNIRSISDNEARRQVNHFRNGKIVRKCVSLKSMSSKQNFISFSMKNKKQQPIKSQKRTGINIVSSVGLKKQIESSAETNS